ncbi:MAG TPA: PTS sugar transporter subunit IIC [Candidatus Krumholzibacteria bacterium]|nr:PTS sugar transporter subunit IIC [Candidatus Krumholzibacteria bacterium]
MTAGGFLDWGDPVGFAGAAVLGGLLALDDTAYAQTWLSQPLPAALLTGLLLGDPLTGLALGLPLQIVLAANIPVGQSFTGDAVTSTVGVTAAAVLAEASQTPALLHGSAGLPELGWLLLAVSLLSIAGQYAVGAERRGNTAWMLRGHRTLRDGDLGRIGRLHLRCMQVTFVRGAVTTVAAAYLVYAVWLPLFGHLPARVQAASGLLALLLPGLGLGAVVEQYGLRRSAPWLAIGAAAVVALGTVVRA